jgi:hypothetical protein
MSELLGVIVDVAVALLSGDWLPRRRRERKHGETTKKQNEPDNPDQTR